ncbi:hypothetical protein H1R20_g2022, partial [Candolleomyces eurysporus]
MVTTRGQTRATTKELDTKPPAQTQPQPARKNGKRAEKVKATSNTKKKNAAAGKRRKNECILTDMPLDVLLEILKYMVPLDLANLSYTNKLFWEMLTGPVTASLWKTARAAYKAPAPPEDFSEPRWAMLLFGTMCQSCGSKTPRGIDWYLRKRFCLACEKLHLVSASRFKSAFRGRDPAILEYLPYTKSGPSTKGWRQYSDTLKIQYYWNEDIEESLQQWEKLSSRKSAKAKDELEAWKKRRKERVASLLEMVPTFSQWDTQLWRLEEEEKENNKKRRLEGAKARLLAMGHEQVDIDSGVTLRTIPTGVPNVTNAVWAKLRRDVEPLVIAAKKKRLVEEVKELAHTRMAILRTRYQHFLAGLPASESYCCPPVEFLGLVPAVREHLEAEKDVSVTAQDFDSVFQEMPNHIAEYQRRKKRTAVDTASERWGHAGPSPRYRVLQGWPMIASHCCVGGVNTLRNGAALAMPNNVVVDRELSAISYILLKLVGLPPDTTAVSEMDEKDARFVCVPCFSERTYQIFTWRGVIYHVACGGHQSTDTMPPFRLATPEDTKLARRATIARRDKAKAWSCNHCLDFIEADNAETKDVVLQHINDK